jgi:hypothetical protein
MMKVDHFGGDETKGCQTGKIKNDGAIYFLLLDIIQAFAGEGQKWK